MKKLSAETSGSRGANFKTSVGTSREIFWETVHWIERRGHREAWAPRDIDVERCINIKTSQEFFQETARGIERLGHQETWAPIDIEVKWCIKIKTSSEPLESFSVPPFVGAPWRNIGLEIRKKLLHCLTGCMAGDVFLVTVVCLPWGDGGSTWIP